MTSRTTPEQLRCEHAAFLAAVLAEQRRPGVDVDHATLSGKREMAADAEPAARGSYCVGAVMGKLDDLDIAVALDQAEAVSDNPHVRTLIRLLKLARHQPASACSATGAKTGDHDRQGGITNTPCPSVMIEFLVLEAIGVDEHHTEQQWCEQHRRLIEQVSETLRLLERSSLGTTRARAGRRRTSAWAVNEVLKRSAIKDSASRKGLGTDSVRWG